MRLANIALVILFLVVAFLAARFFWPREETPVPAPAVVVAPEPVAAPPEIRHPLPPAPAPPAAAALKPLPPLGTSDAFLQELLVSLYGSQRVAQLLVPEHFIQRLVLVVDNLPRKNLPRQHLPLKAPGGSFLVTGDPQAPRIAAANAERYFPYIRLAETLPVDRLVATYHYLYPLFQQAYEEMGYPDGYFNDRLVEVIDHLLTTPDSGAPLLLEPHIQRYRYRDPELESLSAGRKILLRMGAENRRRLQEILREFRHQLVALTPPVSR